MRTIIVSIQWLYIITFVLLILSQLALNGYFPTRLMGTIPNLRKPLFEWIFSDTTNYDYLRKKVQKSVQFENGGHFTDFPFAWSDCTIPRKSNNQFSEGEFQRNLARSSKSSIEIHNWNRILTFLLLRDFTGKIVFYHMPK